MKLLLLRTYFPSGTNGELFYNNKKLCATIELPWKKNTHRISCIPEGAYELRKRCNQKFGQHLWLQDVPGRSLVLIHPANNALKELAGCIAPVSCITGEGTVTGSKAALQSLMTVILSAHPLEDIELVITSHEQDLSKQKQEL